MDQSPGAHILWGWERFFEELSSFLDDINRQAGHSNESYCEYVLERLEVCVESVSSLRDLLRTRPPSVTEGESHIAVGYSTQLTELLRCLRRLYMKWQEYMDRRNTSSSYSTPPYSFWPRTSQICNISRTNPIFTINVVFLGANS